MDRKFSQNSPLNTSGKRGQTASTPRGPSLLVLLCLVLTAAICCLASDRWYKQHLIAEQRASAVSLVSMEGLTLSAAINRRLARLEGLHAFAEANTSAADFGKRFNDYAAGLFAGVKDVRAYTMTQQGVIRYIYPLQGNERAMDFDVLRDPNTREVALRALRNRTATLSDPYELPQGGLGVVARKAVFANERFWGFANVVLDVHVIVAEGMARQDRLDLALRDGKGNVFHGDRRIFEQSPITLRLGLPEGAWVLAGIPKGGWEAFIGRDLLIFRGLSVLVAVCLVSLIFQMYDRQRRMSAAVQDRTAALRESEKYNRALFELSPIGLALRSIDGILVDVNPAFAGILGRTVEETVGLNFWEIIPENYRDQERHQLAVLLTTGSAGPYENEYLRKDGRKVPVMLHRRIIERENVPLIWSIAEDITDRKQAEAVIEREHKLTEALIDSLPGIVYLYDQELHFLRWNKNFERVSGCTAEEIEHLRPLDFFSDADNELLRSRIEEVFAKGASTLEADFLSKDGSRTPFFFTGVRIEIDQKPCVIGVGLDISERKQLEQELVTLNQGLEERVAERTRELRAANDKLKELEQLKWMFIASMSHELRTPLNTIIGFTGMTLKGLAGELNGAQTDNLSRIQRASKHLLSLVTDVIDISKIEAGRMESYPGAVSLSSVVGEAVGAMTPQLRERKLDLAVEVPDVQLYTDRKRLLQCLLNILSNAVKYTESGAITVAARETESEVAISITDTGIGIAEKEIPNIFKAFETLDSHLRVKVGGAGLGLYLTRKIAREILLGDVTFRSKEGEGSTFTVTVAKDLRGKTSLGLLDEGEEIE